MKHFRRIPRSSVITWHFLWGFHCLRKNTWRVISTSIWRTEDNKATGHLYTELQWTLHSCKSELFSFRHHAAVIIWEENMSLCLHVHHLRYRDVWTRPNTEHSSHDTNRFRELDHTLDKRHLFLHLNFIIWYHYKTHWLWWFLQCYELFSSHPCLKTIESITAILMVSFETPLWTITKMPCVLVPAHTIISFH